MARTKQTHRKSTGGKAPRRVLLLSNFVKNRKHQNSNALETLSSKRQRITLSHISLISLSADILTNVLCKFLSYLDLLSLSKISKEFRILICDPNNDAKIWRPFVVSQLLGYEPVDSDLEKMYNNTYDSTSKLRHEAKLAALLRYHDICDASSSAASSSSSSSTQKVTNGRELPRLWYEILKNHVSNVKSYVADILAKHGATYSSVTKCADLAFDSIGVFTQEVELPTGETKSPPMQSWSNRDQSILIFDVGDCPTEPYFSEMPAPDAYYEVNECKEVKQKEHVIVVGWNRIYNGTAAMKQIEKMALPEFKSLYAAEQVPAIDVRHMDSSKMKHYAIFVKNVEGEDLPSSGMALYIADPAAFASQQEEQAHFTETDNEPATLEEWFNKHFAIGESRLGGFPDFPAELDPPNIDGIYIPLLAQFNISQLKICDPNDQLPADGMLWIFSPDTVSPFTHCDTNLMNEPSETLNTKGKRSFKHLDYVIHLSNAEIKAYGGLQLHMDISPIDFLPTSKGPPYFVHPQKIVGLSPPLCKYNELPPEVKSKISHHDYQGVFLHSRRPHNLHLFGAFESSDVIAEYDEERIRNASSFQLYWKEPMYNPPRNMLANRHACDQFIKDHNTIYTIFKRLGGASTPGAQLQSEQLVIRNLLEPFLSANKEQSTIQVFDHKKAYRRVPLDFFKERSVETLPSLLLTGQENNKYLNHEETVELLKALHYVGATNQTCPYPTCGLMLYKQLEDVNEALEPSNDECRLIYELPYSHAIALAQAEFSSVHSKIYLSPEEYENALYPRPKTYVKLLSFSGEDLGPKHYKYQTWQFLLPSHSLDTKQLRRAIVTHHSD